ncbi:MAG: MMPL family transporter [Candidatus Hydrogenedentes bacterium]|nr:MMPL family transporter [Candidatus Hydrogenedentota bacterium]
MLRDEHPFWTAWSRAVIRHPVAIVVCAVLITAVLGVAAWRTPRDLSFTGLLDDRDAELLHFKETVETFGENSMLILLLEGERSEIDRTVALLLEELPKLSEIKSVTPPADAQWLLDRAPWIWPRPLFDSVVRAVESGTTPEALIRTVANTDTAIRDAVRPVEKAALVGIGLYRSPLDIEVGGGDFYRIVRATEAILDTGECAVSHAFTGIVATAAQDQRSVFTRIGILTPITLVVILCMLMGVERRLSRVLVAGLALSFSMAIAFGLTGLTLGRLSIMATFFGMLLLGLGIDFGIHLLVSLRDARSHGMTPEESIRFGIRHTATAIALGGISTALAFGMVALAPEPGARDMGFAALYGLTAALILMLTFLPAAWLMLERRHPNLDTPRRFTLPGLHGLVTFSIRHPLKILGLSLALTVLGVAAIPRYELERDLAKIISREVTTFDVDTRLQELFGFSPMTYLAPVESLEQAREWTREIRRFDDIASVSSVADVVLPDAEERVNIVNATLAALPKNDATGALYERLREAQKLGRIVPADIPASLSSGVMGPEGELALSIVPKENTLDAYVIMEQIDRIRSVAPTATGIAIVLKIAVLGNRDYIPIMIPSILAAVTLIVLLAFRNVRDTALALIPVIMGTAAAFGVFLWFGLQMTVLTSIVVPVILGLGVDDGIHVVERLRQYRIRDDATIVEAVEGVGRAIFLTTATTCVSFVTLLFTNHAGLESVAWFMLVGIPVCFITSITTLPAAAKLLASGTTSDEG